MVTMMILLWAIERMISMTCSESLELRPEVGPELMLVFRFRKIAQHFRGRPEKHQPAAFIEQDSLVEHLEKL